MFMHSRAWLERAHLPHIARLGRSAGLAAGHGGCGGPVRARVSARRRASGSRYRPAMSRTRSAASVAGIPAAVTNSGRAEDPRTTGTAWVAVRNRFRRAEQADLNCNLDVLGSLPG
jgi:hypothetical protein